MFLHKELYFLITIFVELYLRIWTILFLPIKGYWASETDMWENEIVAHEDLFSLHKISCVEVMINSHSSGSHSTHEFTPSTDMKVVHLEFL